MVKATIGAERNLACGLFMAVVTMLTVIRERAGHAGLYRSSLPHFVAPCTSRFRRQSETCARHQVGDKYNERAKAEENGRGAKGSHVVSCFTREKLRRQPPQLRPPI